MNVRRASNSLRLVKPAAPLIERDVQAADSQSMALDWQGPVRLAMDRATGISAPKWQQQIRTGLLERALVLGADHYGGPHLERSEAAERILAHLDALAEAGLSAQALRTFIDEAELDTPGTLWISTLLFGCFDTNAFSDEFESWIESIEATYDEIVEIAEALRILPNPRFRELTRRWLNGRSAIPCAIALEAVSPDQIALEALARIEDHENSYVQVAIERLFWQRPEMQSMLARRNWAWTNASSLDCCYHAARVHLLQRDFEPLHRLRQGDTRAIDALGPYALEILALAGDGRDSQLAAELARSWPTTPQLLDSLGRIGLPSLFPRLLAELESDDFDDEAMLALTTAVGSQNAAELRQNWEQAIEALPKLPEATRLRHGQPYSLSAILEEMKRKELSARDLQLRADELFVRTGKRADIEWHGFGLSLESSLAELVKITR